LAQQNVGSAIEMLLKECGEGQTYFHGKNEEGLTVFVHSSKEEKELFDAMEDAEEILQNAFIEYEEMKEEELEDLE
jgi:hypothetical protein